LVVVVGDEKIKYTTVNKEEQERRRR